MTKKEITVRLLDAVSAGKRDTGSGCPSALSKGREIADPDRAEPLDTGAKGLLLIISGRRRTALHSLYEAMALCRFGYRLTVLVPGELLKDVRRRMPQVALYALEDAEAVSLEACEAVLVVLCRDLAARLALGLNAGPDAKPVIDALWGGIPIYADFSGVFEPDGVPSKNEALRQMYEAYAETLLKLGVRRIEPGEYLSRLREPGGSAGDQPSGEKLVQETAAGSVVTRRDVLDWKLSGRLPAIAPGTIFTALARDEARKMGLELPRRS